MLIEPITDISFVSTFPVPVGAIHVATDGSDLTGDGSQSDPYETLTKAITEAVDGDTIVLRSGTHRIGGVNVSKEVTIQGYYGEQVWIDGSVIVDTGDWVADGPRWRLDASPSANLTDAADAIEDPSQIDPAYPLAGSPQMVVRNGSKQTPAASEAATGPGEFFYDEATAQLYVGSNPTLAIVELVVEAKAIDVTADNVTIRGLGFRHFGSTLSTGPVGFGGSYTMAMVQVANVANAVIDQVWFHRSSSRGLFIGACVGVSVTDCVFIANGMNGVDVFSSAGVLVEGNRITENNANGFSVADGAYGVVAGSKLTETTATYRDNIVDNNGGTGLWFDLECLDCIIVGNVVAENSRHGIMHEVSSGAIIASNVVYRNEDNGIYILGPVNEVWNNTLIANGQNIAVYEDSRSVSPAYECVGNVIKNNVLAYLNGNTPNNVGTPSKFIDVNGFNYSESVAPGLMVTDLDFNLYHRADGSVTSPYLLGWSAFGLSASHGTLVAIQDGTSMEGSGLSVPYTDTLFVDEDQDDFMLHPDSVGVGAGDVLSVGVADAIGVTAGVAVDVGALRVLGASFVPPDDPGEYHTPMPNEIIFGEDLDADAVFDSGKGKVRFESILSGEVAPSDPPPVPEKSWLYADLSTGFNYVWDPLGETWVATSGGGAFRTVTLVADNSELEADGTVIRLEPLSAAPERILALLPPSAGGARCALNLGDANAFADGSECWIAPIPWFGTAADPGPRGVSVAQERDQPAVLGDLASIFDTLSGQTDYSGTPITVTYELHGSPVVATLNADYGDFESGVIPAMFGPLTSAGVSIVITGGTVWQVRGGDPLDEYIAALVTDLTGPTASLSVTSVAPSGSAADALLDLIAITGASATLIGPSGQVKGGGDLITRAQGTDGDYAGEHHSTDSPYDRESHSAGFVVVPISETEKLWTWLARPEDRFGNMPYSPLAPANWADGIEPPVLAQEAVDRLAERVAALEGP